MSQYAAKEVDNAILKPGYRENRTTKAFIEIWNYNFGVECYYLSLQNGNWQNNNQFHQFRFRNCLQMTDKINDLNRAIGINFLLAGSTEILKLLIIIISTAWQFTPMEGESWFCNLQRFWHSTKRMDEGTFLGVHN